MTSQMGLCYNAGMVLETAVLILFTLTHRRRPHITVAPWVWFVLRMLAQALRGLDSHICQPIIVVLRQMAELRPYPPTTTTRSALPYQNYPLSCTLLA